jgi:hypothetical protein
MWRRATVLGLALCAVAADPAAAAPVCGPAGARTLDANRDARIYTWAGSVVGCHRLGPRPWKLGTSGRVLELHLNHGFVAVRHRARRTGERLSVVDLRRWRRLGRQSTPGRFTRIRLVHGIAAFLTTTKDGDGPPEVLVGATDGDPFASGVDIDPRFLAFAGSTVAWRRGPTYELSALEDAIGLPPGRLFRIGRLRVEAREVRSRYSISTRLWAIRPGRRPLRLGEPKSVCVSSSGCSGISALQVAGRYLATVDMSYGVGGSYDDVKVYDLRHGTRRRECDFDLGGVYAFVLTDAGGLACAVDIDFKQRQIVSGGAVIDEGEGIDLWSLRRDGDRLVWLHDGAGRSAPLPQP